MNLDPGIHDSIPADDYHADRGGPPSLSAHIANLLITRSPLHAYTHHPRLNPGYHREEKAHFDVGTVAHALLLEGSNDRVHVVFASDWRTKDAKEARDDARAAGLIPLLTDDWERVRAMVAAVRQQLAALDITPPLFDAGKAEQTLVWQEDGVQCRARLDWLRDDLCAIEDMKTTAASGNPHDWTRRTLWSIGADVQVAFYLRGLKRVTGRDADWRYLVAESTPPYACSVISLAPSALELGARKVEWAIRRWRECVETDMWPGYYPRIAYAEVDAWAEPDFVARTWTPDEEVAA